MAETMELVEAPASQPLAPTTQPTAQHTELSVVEYAIKNGAPVSEVRELVELQVRMDQHRLLMLKEQNEIDRQDRAEAAARAFATAMAGFKAESVKVIRNRDITDGPLKGKKYADLFSVVDAATQALSKHGLSATWRTVSDERDWITIACCIKHVDGHSEETQFGGPIDTGPGRNAIQARKSTVTYLERITMLLALGLAEQDADDDGAGGPKIGDSVTPEALAIEARDGWIAAINECKSEVGVKNTWQAALNEIGPMNRLDIHQAVRKSVSDRLAQLKEQEQ